jgi:hypothetical protein
MALAGFLGGFSERMVPDLLASAVAKTGEAPVVRTPIHDPDPTIGSDRGGPAEKAGGLSDSGGIATGIDPVPAQALEDCCVSELQLADGEITPDGMLPAASGGVAGSTGASAG